MDLSICETCKNCTHYVYTEYGNYYKESIACKRIYNLENKRRVDLYDGLIKKCGYYKDKTENNFTNNNQIESTPHKPIENKPLKACIFFETIAIIAFIVVGIII